MSCRHKNITCEYMDWAKTRSHAKCNLATSGLLHYPIRDLGISIEDIELSGPSFYGFEPLQFALARKCGVPPDCIVAAIGTSMANHLAMAALLEPGDEVLVEHPAYEPLLSVAHYLGAEVRRFRRKFETGFAIDPAEVERSVTPRTRLIVITNLHNPSSALTDDDTLKSLAEIARSVKARILVDTENILELVGQRQQINFITSLSFRFSWIQKLDAVRSRQIRAPMAA